MGRPDKQRRGEITRHRLLSAAVMTPTILQNLPLTALLLHPTGNIFRVSFLLLWGSFVFKEK
jgi:hypothetical protein